MHVWCWSGTTISMTTCLPPKGSESHNGIKTQQQHPGKGPPSPPPGPLSLCNGTDTDARPPTQFQEARYKDGGAHWYRSSAVLLYYHKYVRLCQTPLFHYSILMHHISKYVSRYYSFRCAKNIAIKKSEGVSTAFFLWMFPCVVCSHNSVFYNVSMFNHSSLSFVIVLMIYYKHILQTDLLISWCYDVCLIRWFNIPSSKITEQPTMDG